MLRRTSTVSGMGLKNQLVRIPVPKDVAQLLGLKSGETMLWTVLDDGTITLERADQSQP